MQSLEYALYSETDAVPTSYTGIITGGIISKLSFKMNLIENIWQVTHT